MRNIRAAADERGFCHMSKAKEAYRIHSVRNAMRILQLFSVDRPEWGITEMADALGLSKSTVHRAVTALVEEGFLEKNPRTDRYRLGLSVLGLCGVVISHMTVHREAAPILERLAERVGETAYLGILEGTDVVYLSKVECKHPVRSLSHIGKKNPAHCTGTGKAILAFQPSKRIEEVIRNGLIPYGPRTITDPETFRRHLADIRNEGYAVCIDEIADGVASVGAPVRDYTGEVIAAISVVGPTERLVPKLAQVIPEVVKGGREISQGLGYAP